MIYRILFLFCLIVFTGCRNSDDRFFDSLGQINNVIDGALEAYDREDYAVIISSLEGVDKQIDSAGIRFPDKHKELMPHFQKAVTYALLSAAYSALDDEVSFSRFQNQFRQEIDVLKIKDITYTDFLHQVIKAETKSIK